MSSGMSKTDQGGSLALAPQYRPELELLLTCGGPHIQATKEARARELLEADLDWERVLRLGMWHHMIPLLHWNLAARRNVGVPDEVQASLKTAFMNNVGRSLRMTADLIAILQDMGSQGIEAVPYKGPVLASRLYGNVSLRQSSDLDIVVCRADVEGARQSLMRQGYVPFIMLQDSNHKFRMESRYSERFDRGREIVELHWAFTNKDVAFPLDLSDLMPRMEKHSVGGRALTVFGSEDLILILCVHGAKHGWNRLEWICGVSEFLYANQDLDWGYLCDRAKETGSLRRLLLGLLLASCLYEAPLPDRVRRLIASESSVAVLGEQVTKSLFDGDNDPEGAVAFGSIDHDIFHFKLGDGLLSRLRYFGYRLTTPSQPERWSSVSIAGRSFSLHSFTRPFKVGRKLISVAIQSLDSNRDQQ